jgi:type IV secretion/conjugal transfer VirB4 family ATPase
MLVKLKDYSPHILSGDDVASYWAWLLNGRHQMRKLPASGWLDDILATSDLKFPTGKRYGIYSGDKDRFSSMLYVVADQANATDPRFLDGLFRLHHEFSIWQIMRRVEKPAALSDIEDRIKNTVAFKASGEIILVELNELRQRIEADELTMQRHKFCIEVYGDTLQDLERAVQEVRSVVENRGFGVKRESRNHEAHFWSRFPEFDRRIPKGPPNPRERGLTSENAAHFCTFASAGEGLDSCSWGDMPVTHFKTQQGSEFAFTFHGSPARMWPGHTLVIGGNNSGKTTLISFLLAMSTKYPDWRCFLFDRLHGLEVFTRMMGGDYLDIIDGLEVNPLMLPDDAETRAFLSNWFQVLTGRDDDASLLAIDSAIRATFALDRKDRSLPNIAEAFGLPVEGSIRASLQRWIAGQFAGFFTAERDAMDFTRQIVGIDMTTLLDLPEVLAPLSYYLFHKLLIQARGKGGYAVFVDELPRYLANPGFAPKIDMMLQELRKTDGVFIGAAQSADSIINSNSADKFLTNVETYLLFPEPRARREHFRGEGLRLNDQEYLWLTQTHRPREVLLKRKSGESTVLNVDLSSLGEFLKVFDSSSDAVNSLNQLRRERHDWQDAYLRG